MAPLRGPPLRPRARFGSPPDRFWNRIRGGKVSSWGGPGSRARSTACHRPPRQSVACYREAVARRDVRAREIARRRVDSPRSWSVTSRRTDSVRRARRHAAPRITTATDGRIWVVSVTAPDPRSRDSSRKHRSAAGRDRAARPTAALLGPGLRFADASCRSPTRQQLHGFERVRFATALTEAAPSDRGGRPAEVTFVDLPPSNCPRHCLQPDGVTSTIVADFIVMPFY
jgi:hypothetical protein